MFVLNVPLLYVEKIVLAAEQNHGTKMIWLYLSYTYRKLMVTLFLFCLLIPLTPRHRFKVVQL